MLTLHTLLEEVGLEAVAGEQRLDVPVRSVHASELLDPTRFLSGGELLLTTGVRLTTVGVQRAFVKRLSDSRIAALGFGTGLDHDRIPEALIDAARKLSFPVFEVPYDVPFIAITERAFAHLADERYEALRRSASLQAELERLVLEGRGLEQVLATVSGSVGAGIAVLGPRGELLAAHGEGVDDGALAQLRARIAGSGEGGDDDAEAVLLPVAQGGRPTPQAWLAALPGLRALNDADRLVLRQTVTVVALELMRRRIERDTERRLAGDVLAEALTGRLSPEELQARLAPFGIGAHASVIVFEVEDPGAAAPELDAALAQEELGHLVAARGPLLCAVIDAAGADAEEVARAARARLAATFQTVRAAASRPAPTGSLRRSFHEARCALEAVRLHNGRAPDVASHRDLGAFSLLLSVQDDDALRSYCEGVLGAIADGDNGAEGYGEELLRSLEAFIEHNGQWERASRELYCHRHTLRYRIRRVEELTGRDLGRARDRIEIWLALRGRELLR